MELGPRDLHIWRVSLLVSEEQVARWEQVLPAPEIERSRRFYHAVHRRAYTVSHGVLRTLLAKYLGASPQQLAFCYGRAGKPALEDMGTDLAFNMSHSGDLAVYAFARDCRLGVDIEQVRPMADLELVASQFFSAEERSELLALEAADRVAAFFRCWTRKEAYIKAIGDGLLIPLKSFRVSLAPGQPAALLHAADSNLADWHMHHLAPAADYVGAVAHDGAARQVRQFGDRLLNP
jgi:4'-phosphopantetheinyl transferase